jgi:hypothetical protein
VKRALLLASGAFGLFAAPAPAQDRYVPISIESDARDDAFYETWFGSRLREMGEPILSRPHALGRFSSRLRMLVLPSQGHLYAIRIDESGTGAQVSFVELSRGSSAQPARVLRRRYARLSTADMRGVRHLVRDAGLASASARAEPRPETPLRTADGQQRVIFCHHPTVVVFELVDAGGSHFLYRDVCDISPALLRLAEEIRSIGPDQWRTRF